MDNISSECRRFDSVPGENFLPEKSYIFWFFLWLQSFFIESGDFSFSFMCLICSETDSNQCNKQRLFSFMGLSAQWQYRRSRSLN
ncbi:hypothetical protein ACQKWADRAFT_89426 [Trichoderma austrokoningii]